MECLERRGEKKRKVSIARARCGRFPALHYEVGHKSQGKAAFLEVRGFILGDDLIEGSLALRPPALVEMYDRQVYLSHLQTRALYWGRESGLRGLTRINQKTETEGVVAGEATPEQVSKFFILKVADFKVEEVRRQAPSG